MMSALALIILFVPTSQALPASPQSDDSQPRSVPLTAVLSSSNGIASRAITDEPLSGFYIFQHIRLFRAHMPAYGSELHGGLPQKESPT